MELSGHSQIWAQSHTSTRTTTWWGQPFSRARSLTVPELSCVSEASDLSVTKPVVDEREKLSGGGDLGDVAATSCRHPLIEVPESGVATLAVQDLRRR